MNRDEISLFSEVEIKSNYFEVDESIWLKVYFFKPRKPKLKHTLIFIPGWTSTIFSWRYFLPNLSKNIDVIYIETREKSSSKTTPNCSYDVKTISNDIVMIIKNLNLKNYSYSLSGSSLGATVIIESLISKKLFPKTVALILPNKYFNIPSSIYLINFLPNSFFGIIKTIIKWYMIYFKISKNDQDHKKSFIRSINNIDRDKINKSALAFKKYKMNEKLITKIKIETLIIGASKDKLHDHKQVLSISALLPKSEYIDLVSFSRSHSSKAAESILFFLERAILKY